MRCCPYADGNASPQTNLYGSPGRGGPGEQLPFFAHTGYPVYTTSPVQVHQRNPSMLPFGFMPLSALPPVFTNHLGAPLSFNSEVPAVRHAYHSTSFGTAQGPTGAAVLPSPYDISNCNVNLAQEAGRPLTPSPTGSTGSSCSFAFSAGDILSPATTTSTIASPSTPRIVEFGSVDNKGSPLMPSTEQIQPEIPASQRIIV